MKKIDKFVNKTHTVYVLRRLETGKKNGLFIMKLNKPFR